MRKSYVMMVLLFVIMVNVSCSGDQNQPIEKHSESFNTTDLDAKTNGNMQKAIIMYNGNPVLGVDSPILSGKPDNAGVISRKPFTALGKQYKLIGRIYSIKEVSASWTEMLITATDPNSNFGIISVDFICKGDFSTLKNKATVEISGYFVGVATSKNAFGGDIDTLVLVGNYARPRSMYLRTRNISHHNAIPRAENLKRTPHAIAFLTSL